MPSLPTSEKVRILDFLGTGEHLFMGLGIKGRIIREWNWSRLRAPKSAEPFVIDEVAVRRALEQSAIPMRETTIDVEAYREFLANADYETHHPGYYAENFTEKSLEHYLAARALGLPDSPGIDYLDVASQNGTAAEVYGRLYGVTPWRQDLDFPEGVHDHIIGSNAASIPMPDGSFDAMALHCSFEHFERDSDSGFIREAARLLRPGGRLVILPLYLAQYYLCLVDPMALGSELPEYEPDMTLHAMHNFGNRHCRFYDLPHFLDRVWNQRQDLTGEILVVTNYRDPDPSCYIRFILVLRKPE